MDIKTSDEKLKELVAIFSKENILYSGLVQKLYNESVIEEREFTKQFYKLYHETRLMLVKEFQYNSQVTKQQAIHYAQLFLNRLIFLFFAEDTEKVRKRLFTESILLSLNNALLVSEYSRRVSDTIVDIFQRLDKGSWSPVEIFGFNGGLFAEKIPSNIFFNDLRDLSFFNKELQYSTLKDELVLDEYSRQVVDMYEKNLNPLIKNLLILGSYDFQSDLNVNILGHIFEQSLTDLEELQGADKISRRKKEGIYYTPEYVTDYICRKTIIPHLSGCNSQTIDDLVDEYSENIEELERKFQDLKILDAACGSGAFLLKTVDVLLEIQKKIQIVKESHGKYIILKKNKKTGSAELFTLSKWNEESEARRIIENNIFGVDINEESAEITKLSLFLKIATGNRKLMDLSRNIRVGNSLISDKEVSDKPFNWKHEFKEILDNGGFDIIIGNPPYIRVQQLRYRDIDYLKSEYWVAHKRIDISIIFFELATRLIKQNGKIGFISSSQFMTAEYGRNLRKLLSSKRIEKFVDFDSLPIFEDAVTYPAIIIFSNNKPLAFSYFAIKKLDFLLMNSLDSILSGSGNGNFTKSYVDPKNLKEEGWLTSLKDMTE